MPLCRPMGNGLWEVRTDLPTKRTSRVLLCLYREHLVALHGFIKKTRATPESDLATARKRQKELTRISHRLTVEARDRPAITSLRLLAVLDGLPSTPPLVKRRAPRTDAPLTHFASPRGEKSGLER
jgi:hypothetical protein